MRLATIRTSDGVRAARVEGDHAVLLGHSDVGALLAEGPHALADAAQVTGPTFDVATLDYAPLVPNPGKVFCLGLNYLGHIRETGREVPEFPTLFAKFADALCGARDPITLPPESSQVDWEAELAVVIGKPIRRATEAQALDAIAGYTICNDISMRDYQYRTLQWLQGKTWEASTPLGPVLVTPDEIDHARDVEVRCEVDGVLRQCASTSELVHSPGFAIAYISTICTLRPGDVISTGTPAGVGMGMDPPTFLARGQTVRCSIAGIGELVNRCV
ncbi:MAG: fumarylacetoacetate hydrolase family protein [Actinobacteria bacterium]|nr:MAG: fumarylacetoacetate hydrolase family protein [Actinomycetota bacterium]